MENEKKNRLVYFYAYLSIQVLYVYVNAYLPIYFVNASSVDLTKLALVLFTSYSFMFIKPIFALVLDRRVRSGNDINRKLLMSVGSIGILISFSIFLVSLELFVIFALFMGINFAFVSIVDVIVDKFIIEQNMDERIKEKNALSMQLGAVIGAILPNLFYFFLISDRTSLLQWTLFFIVGIAAVVPLVPVVALLHDKRDSKWEKTQEEAVESAFSLKAIALMCIFLFLVYGENLYNWLLEPWAVELVGNELFSIIMIGFVLVNAIGLIIAGKISHKYNTKLLLLLSTFIYGILLALAPFLNIYIFFLFIGIDQILAGFMLINMITIMIDLSRKHVLIFQIMASCIILAKVIFIPLGIALSASNTTEVIIALAGILTALSVIPLYFVEK